MLSERNITELLVEEENLRKFRHDNVIGFFGTCGRRGPGRGGGVREGRGGEAGAVARGEPGGGALQILTVMELCDSTLRFRIIGRDAVNPGKLGAGDGQYSRRVDSRQVNAGAATRVGWSRVSHGAYVASQETGIFVH